MKEDSVKQRIEELCELLNRYNYAYYMEDLSLVSDFEFDRLLKELQELEKQYPQWVLPYSPTHRVGGEINKHFKTYAHKSPMLSLGNTYSIEDLTEFENRVKRLIHEPFTYVCELKFDGVAIGLEYRQGVLYRALTRGDGMKGDEVTDNVKTIGSIPLKLKPGDYPDEFEIRGEVIMPYDSFIRLNREKEERGEEIFANPRNAASGSLKLQDSGLTAQRKLDCFLYYVVGDQIQEPTHIARLLKAKEWGFQTGDFYRECKSLEEVLDYIKEWDQRRKELKFAIDGVVIKINQTHLWKELGYTAKSPRWAIAYKFKAERVCTPLEKITFQVGRTGAITPVANLKPVALGGTIVKRASLHNADIIEKLDVRENDWVYVEKGGEIIPKIVGVDTSRRDLFSQPFQYITRCPECGAPLERKEGEAQHYCVNEEGCPPQIKGKLLHFISKKAMDIDSLGEGKIELLFQKQIVRNIADLYDLKYSDLYLLENKTEDRVISFREKTVENILQGIEASKKADFPRVLFALGIRNVGVTTAQLLAETFQSIDALMQADEARLCAVNEIGEVIAKSIVEYFSRPEHLEIIRRLKAHGLQFEMGEEYREKLSRREQGVLASSTWVVSGVFSRSRDEMKALIEEHGGKITSSISAKTSYVLAGEKMGPEKRKKAESLNIPLVSEQEFEKMIHR